MAGFEVTTEGIPVVGGCIVRVQFDGTAEFSPRGLPVPVVVLHHQSQRGVSFGQTLVNLESTQGRGARLRHELGLRNHTVAAQQGIRIRQASIGAGIVRVFGRRLLKIVDRPPESFNRPLVQEILGFEVEIVGFIGLRG